jgi:hypothetical protein
MLGILFSNQIYFSNYPRANQRYFPTDFLGSNHSVSIISEIVLDLDLLAKYGYQSVGNGSSNCTIGDGRGDSGNLLRTFAYS